MQSQRAAQVTESTPSDKGSTCFGRHQHPSSGAQNNCNHSTRQPPHRTAARRHRGRVGTDMSVFQPLHDNSRQQHGARAKRRRSHSCPALTKMGDNGAQNMYSSCQIKQTLRLVHPVGTTY